MGKFKFLTVFNFLIFFFVSLTVAQVKDAGVKKSADTLKAKVVKIPNKQAEKSTDTSKPKYINPGKIAGHKAMIKSFIIPGWGQLYNNQILVRDYKAKGENGGHFWQKTYTLGKIGVIYTGFTLLTMSYIDNSKGYKTFLKEAQYRQLNPGMTENPTLVRYSDEGVKANKDVFKRNKQVVIFSLAAVYLVNVADAYVAARLHYFNIDDNLSFKVTPSLINSAPAMYGFNPVPALKISLNL
ncbi:hypothetical protein EZJ43_05410 [Pedobacter changchengzhani]|uniref:DUF5683 domain-containing protein n=1 Tax=Pedobacter changchengzhani TaxID=2529274 RepID=A0A4V3A0E5_9SPHI|nr:DUF5683 domain-containing protein [Pedobacter changchengzhani]TDG36723.1 hypothetical protein EZJ43_05410 [Pedobacter changchengzhani]